MEKRKAGVVNEELYDYTFDSLLLPPCTTDSLYTQRISPIVKAAMEGYNATGVCVLCASSSSHGFRRFNAMHQYRELH